MFKSLVAHKGAHWDWLTIGLGFAVNFDGGLAVDLHIGFLQLWLTVGPRPTPLRDLYPWMFDSAGNVVFDHEAEDFFTTPTEIK
jgi:hypothetical protein